MPSSTAMVHHTHPSRFSRTSRLNRALTTSSVVELMWPWRKRPRGPLSSGRDSACDAWHGTLAYMVQPYAVQQACPQPSQPTLPVPLITKSKTDGASPGAVGSDCLAYLAAPLAEPATRGCDMWVTGHRHCGTLTSGSRPD